MILWPHTMSLKLAKLVKKQKTNELQAELLQTLPSPPPPAAAAAPPPSSVRTNVLLLENEVGCSDLTKLDEIDEESFVQNLKVRFLNKQIYVSTIKWIVIYLPNWIDLHRIDCDSVESLRITAIVFHRGDCRLRASQYSCITTAHVKIDQKEKVFLSVTIVSIQICTVRICSVLSQGAQHWPMYPHLGR